MRSASLLAAVGLSLVLASPALAQMKMSAPSKQQTMSPSKGVASGDDEYRHTTVGGLEIAQILPEGQMVAGFGGPNGRHGLGNNLELNWTSGIVAFDTAGTFGIAPRATAKYLILGGPAMTVAGYGYLSPKANNIRTFDAAFGGGVPVSLWNMGPGDLHVVPGYDVGNVVAPPATDFGLGALSVSVAYEMPLNPKWSLVITDKITGTLFTAGIAANTLSVGSRVRFSKNITVDVGSVTLTGTTLGVTLVNAGWAWGGKPSDVLKGLGLGG